MTKTQDNIIPARISKRIIAFIIDTFLVYSIMFLFRKAFLYVNLEVTRLEQIKGSINKLLFFSFYSIIFTNFIFRGQTIGKKIMKIWIVNSDDDDLSLMNLLNREILGKVFIERIDLWILLFLSHLGLLQGIISSVNDSILSLVLWYLISMPWVTFISFTIFINNKERLSLHDIISKTKVVEKMYEK